MAKKRKATTERPAPISQSGKAAQRPIRHLTLEEQRALGIDTGPVLVISSVPRRPRALEKPKGEETA